MKCPKCHNENKYDNLTCDYCMAVLPMSEERKKEIEKRHKLEQKEKLRKSMDKIIGMVLALIVIVGIVLWGLFR